MTTSSTAIIDYKMGNIWSLKNALDNLKIKYQESFKKLQQ